MKMEHTDCLKMDLQLGVFAYFFYYKISFQSIIYETMVCI